MVCPWPACVSARRQAGRSGQSMTQVIFGREFEQPLGRLLLAYRNGKVDHPLPNTLGLMNACQIPLQPAAYADDIRERFGDFLPLLEAIRSRPESKIYHDHRRNRVRELVLSDLRRQLRRLVQHELHIIPCGRVAGTFFSLAGIASPTWDVHAIRIKLRIMLGCYAVETAGSASPLLPFGLKPASGRRELPVAAPNRPRNGKFLRLFRVSEAQ